MPIADRVTRPSSRWLPPAAVLLLATALVGTGLVGVLILRPPGGTVRPQPTTLPMLPRVSEAAPGLTWTPVSFSVSAGLNATIGVSLGFDASFGLTGQPIDAGSSMTGGVSLAPVPNATLGLESTGLSGQVPIATLGSTGPVTVPGLTYPYNFSGVIIPLSLAVVSSGTINGSYSLRGATTSAATPFAWSSASNATFTVSAPAGGAGGSIDLNVTGLRYEIRVGLDAVGTVPIFGSITVPLVPLTLIASVAGAPSTLEQVYQVTAPPSIGSFRADPDSVGVNLPTALTVNASGGSGPLTYVYSGLPSGCTGASSPSVSCRPTSPGTYAIAVQVADPQGLNATATTTLTVTAGTSAPAGGGGGGASLSNYLLPAVIALAIAGAVLAFYLGRRGRKVPPGPIKPADPS